MTRLVIARHGNTFGPGDTVTYVGARTDLPLVDKGREQAQALGRYLKMHNLLPDAVYCSELQRTRETAELALKEARIREPVFPLAIFNEIDYGPDENKTRDEIVARIGERALQDWDERSIVPDGWHIAPKALTQSWRGFADHIHACEDTVHGGVLDIRETVLVVTSNGVARFAPLIARNFEEYSAQGSFKLATGALGILEQDGEDWIISGWNIRPS